MCMRWIVISQVGSVMVGCASEDPETTTTDDAGQETTGEPDVDSSADVAEEGTTA